MRKTHRFTPFSALARSLGTRSQKIVNGCHGLVVPCAFVVAALCFLTIFAYVGYKAEAYVLPYKLNSTITRLPFSQNETLPCVFIDNSADYITGKTFRFPVSGLPDRQRQLSTAQTSTIQGSTVQAPILQASAIRVAAPYSSTAQHPAPSRPQSTSLSELYYNNLLRTYGFRLQKPDSQVALASKNPFLESLLTVDNPAAPYVQEVNQCNPAEGQPSLLAFSHRTPGAYKEFNQRGQVSHYRNMAERHARKYNLPANLVMAIIKAESNFNPHAVSAQQAVGLMQIVPNTAGEEVYTYLHGYASTPGLETLFQPDHNILYGTTYLHLLEKRYFQRISDQTSRQLCIIAAYNGGPGAVLRVFDNNMDAAIGIINSMTPDEIYSALSTGMPFAESRQYIDLVLGNIRNF